MVRLRLPMQGVRVRSLVRELRSHMPHGQKKTKHKTEARTFLVVQWLRIRLPMQGTRVRPLVQEDPTCRGATKPASLNC